MIDTVEWRIYYGDGSTYDNLSGPVEDAPSRDVQVIVLADELVGRSMWHSKDYYWYDNGLWVAGDDFGLWDYLSRPGWKKVLFGRTLTKPEFLMVLEKAQADTGFLTKSGWHQTESRPEV